MPKPIIVLFVFVILAYFIIQLPHTPVVVEKDIIQSEIATSSPKITFDEPSESPKIAIAPMPVGIVKERASEIVKPITPPIKLIPIGDLGDQTRDAIVNVYCTQAKSAQNIVGSGSGVVIDSSGVILTNAHVAQYFLLSDYNGQPFVNCTIRTGSPARSTYLAELIYIPNVWVRENAKFLNSQSVTSTGEHDFALLKITGTVNGDALPPEFPFVPHGLRSVQDGTNALVTAYPAGFIGSATIAKNLYKTSAPVVVQEIYSFDDPPQFLDIVTLGGSIVAQKGSSGGAVIEMEQGELVGLVVTSSTAEKTDDRMLNALTVEYINRELVKQAGTNIAGYIAGEYMYRDLSAERQLLFDEIK